MKILFIQGGSRLKLAENGKWYTDGNFTDDCSMLEELNIPVYIVNGSYTNIKITIKSDLDFAKLYI